MLIFIYFESYSINGNPIYSRCSRSCSELCLLILLFLCFTWALAVTKIDTPDIVLNEKPNRLANGLYLNRATMIFNVSRSRYSLQHSIRFKRGERNGIFSIFRRVNVCFDIALRCGQLVMVCQSKEHLSALDTALNML